MSSSSSQHIKLPLQLASLIHGEAGVLLPAMATEAAETADAAPAQQQQQQQPSLNMVIAAAQNRHTKELGSYVRTVCMRMGIDNVQGKE